MIINESPINKCMIIDFDHTIGYFQQLIYLMNIIKPFIRQNLQKKM